MRLEVKYFGMITEWASTEEESIEVDGTSVADLKYALVKRIPQLKDISYQIALNQKLVNSEALINDADVVAVLPPFAGG